MKRTKVNKRGRVWAFFKNVHVTFERINDDRHWTSCDAQLSRDVLRSCDAYHKSDVVRFNFTVAFFHIYLFQILPIAALKGLK